MYLISPDRYAIAAQEDRCAPRTRLTIPVRLRLSGAGAIETVVHDLSISGFSAATLNRMHEGQLCWLTLPGLEARQANDSRQRAIRSTCAAPMQAMPAPSAVIGCRHFA